MKKRKKWSKRVLALAVSASILFSGQTFVFAMDNAATLAVSEEGMKGYWDFEGSDPMINGGTDSGLKGQLKGNAISVKNTDTEFGNVLHFDKRNGESARMLIPSAINSGGEDMTISLWLNRSSTLNPSAKTIILQQSGNGRTLLYNQNEQYVTYISAADVPLGNSKGMDKWEHLVLVKSGQSPYTVKLYVNGEQTSQKELSQGAVNAVTDLIVGAHKNTGDTGQFEGDIDELRIYNRAVTEEEVQALFAEHEDVVLEQELSGIRKSLKSLIDEAKETYDENQLEDGNAQRIALKEAIEKAENTLETAKTKEELQAGFDELNAALKAYNDAAMMLTIEPGEVSRTIGDAIFGINHRYGFNGYGSFDSETMQMKEDFTKLYDEAGFGSLRYPGGTISNLFNWKETIGDKENRVPQIHGFYNNAGQHGLMPNFGLGEVANFVQANDSELVYVYALARGDADDAADLVEYLNAEVGSNPNGGTAWADVRAKNGHEEPFDVRYFEIGNEMYQGGTDGTTAQTYWIDDVPGGALEGYVNGGTATFQKQYAVVKGDWNESQSYSDGSADQVFHMRYARVEKDKNAEGYADFTAVNKGNVHVYVAGEEWKLVDDLSAVSADEKAAWVDYKTGAIHFGDGVHGAIPAKGSQIRVDYSVDRDGFVAISQSMRDTMDQINEYNKENGIEEKEFYAYSSFETENFVTKMHNEGHDALYDGLTIHPYSGTPAGGSTSESARETFYYDAMKKGDAQAAKVQNYVTLMQKYDKTKVPVISEYGIFRSTDKMVRSQTHALYIARAIMEYVQLGSPYIQKHCLVDWYSDGADSLGPTQQAVIQAVSVGGDTATGEGEFKFFSTPSARVFEMLNSSFGNQVTKASLNAKQTLDNGVAQYSVLTSKDEEGNIYAAIVNLNLESENQIQIKVDGYDLSGKTMEIQEISGDTFYTENTLEEPDNVKVERHTETIKGENAVLTMKPHSFTVVKIVDALNETEEPEGKVSTAVLEYALELAKTADTEGVIASVADQFQKALDHAQDIYDKAKAGDGSITQEDVDNSWKELIRIMQYLFFKQGDKTDLEKVAAMANGLDLNNYLSEGQDVFLAALEVANTVLEDEDAMQDEVDSAWRNLLKAMADLRLKPDKSALEELVNTAQGMDMTGNSEEEVRNMQAALAYAVEVLEDEEVTNEEVTKAEENLRAALSVVAVSEKEENVQNQNQDVQKKQIVASVDKDSDAKVQTTGSQSNIKSAKTGDMTDAAAMMTVFVMTGGLLAAGMTAKRRKNR